LRWVLQVLKVQVTITEVLGAAVTVGRGG
jgi:hypothetical protein